VERNGSRPSELFEQTLREIRTGEFISTFIPLNQRLGRVGLAFIALILIAAATAPASAQEKFEDRIPFRENFYDCNRGSNCRVPLHHRYRHYDDGYYAPRPRYYEQPRAYYPQPRYYQPGPSFNLTIPLGD